MIEKASSIAASIAAFWTTLYAQGLPDADSIIGKYGFAVFASMALGTGMYLLFLKYDKAHRNRIKTLELEVKFYRDKLFAKIENEKKKDDHEKN